jgi:hypothetical protein
MIHTTETCSNPLTKLIIAVVDGNSYVNIDMLLHKGMNSAKIVSLKFVQPQRRAKETGKEQNIT